jgi:YkoY family integral membrane protein
VDWNAILATVTPTNLGMVLQLAILEGLLSFDNALALAALVSGRLSHPDDRKHALLWGIWGAYIIRIGIVFVGVWLMEHEWVKLLAGLYLIWMAVHELFLKKEPAEAPENVDAAVEEMLNAPSDKGPKRATLKKIIGVIIAVELMDLMFSIDSIAVALAVSNERWVLITGAVIGILMMRIAASYFVKLIGRFPILVPTAFVLVGIAGLKVVAEVSTLEFGDTRIPMLGFHVPEYVFLPLMFAILIGAVVYNAMNPDRFKTDAGA